MLKILTWGFYRRVIIIGRTKGLLDYPEANYGPNLDIYNGQILGFEIDGKRHLMVLKQLWTSALVGS
jgi:hypothetical protein